MHERHSWCVAGLDLKTYPPADIAGRQEAQVETDAADLAAALQCPGSSADIVALEA